MKSTACALLAMLMTGCAVTREEAQAMDDHALCWNYYDQFSFSGRTENILRSEIAARGLDCSQVGHEYRRALSSVPVPPPGQVPGMSCTSRVVGSIVHTSCY